MTPKTSAPVTMTDFDPEASSLLIGSFGITGMTCASYVHRIEKAIGKVEGVEVVSVNLATEG